MLDIEGPHFVTATQPLKKLPLTHGKSWTIGRGPESAFPFDDSAMSRLHALVEETQPGCYYFIDCGSRNGSELNGRRVTTPMELHDGDRLVCGGTALVFCQPKQEAQPERSPTKKEVTVTVTLHSMRLVTVLVVDIRDFTGLTRQIGEERLGRAISAWGKQLGSLFRGAGCATEKFIGDAAMAVWVHESCIPDQNQVRQVLQTLLEIQKITTSLQERFALPAPVRIGGGINTGLGTLGNKGAQDNPDFSPLGDSVNAAFRLESATRHGGLDVALGRLSFECLGGAPQVMKYFEKRMVELKGYDEPVEAWLTSFSSLGDFLVRTR